MWKLETIHIPPSHVKEYNVPRERAFGLCGGKHIIAVRRSRFVTEKRGRQVGNLRKTPREVELFPNVTLISTTSFWGHYYSILKL